MYQCADSRNFRFPSQHPLVKTFKRANASNYLGEKSQIRVGLGCRFETNCPLVGPG